MKGFASLLLYFFTNSSLILGAVAVGLTLLALMLSVAPYAGSESPLTGGMLIAAYLMLLVVPYFGSARVVRIILGNRGLASVPGLPFTTGLALFALTLITAVIPPLTFWLLGAPAVVLWAALYIFIVASMSMLAIQSLVTSRYLVVAVNWLPIVLIALVSLFQEQLLALARSGIAIMTLAALTLAGWLYAFAVLARRRNFRTWYRGHEAPGSGGIYLPWLTAWIEAQRDQRISPAGSLLFGYPASLRARVWNIAGLMLLNPLVSILLVELMSMTGTGDLPFDTATFFVSMSLVTVCITTLTNYREAGARARLLWLHVGGARARVWDWVERELWTNFMLQSALATAIALTLALYGEGSAFLLHYVVLIFVIPLYECYLMLCARINRWPSLMFAVAVLASLALTAYAVYQSLRFANFNVMLLAELGLLLCAVLFRSIAKAAFTRVDWQILRPVQSAHKDAIGRATQE